MLVSTDNFFVFKVQMGDYFFREPFQSVGLSRFSGKSTFQLCIKEEKKHTDRNKNG